MILDCNRVNDAGRIYSGLECGQSTTHVFVSATVVVVVAMGDDEQGAYVLSCP